MSPATLTAVCDRARPELAALGDLGAPLLATLAVVERVGAGRGVDALTDPTFGLDVLAGGADAALLGRVLDFLRTRADITGSPLSALSPRATTISAAVDSYRASALRLLAPGTTSSYKGWIKRLVVTHGADDVTSVTTGDLQDLIATYVLPLREADTGRGGYSAEETAVAAFRHFWRYMVQKKWVTENIAAALTKPPRVDSLRRPWRPDEAALLRHLARSLRRDPLLDELTLLLAERIGLRRAEANALRICDVDLEERVIRVLRGKGRKPRRMSIPPVFAGFLALYIEDRRPAHIPAGEWAGSTHQLLRHRPTAKFPEGRPAALRRVDRLFAALRDAAPALFDVDESQSIHVYRHTLATWVDANYSRAVTRAVLGHTSKRTPTDHYVHVDDEVLAEAMAAYEQHLLRAEPGYKAAA